MKTLDKNIVEWWNTNAFLGDTIDEPKDILDCFAFYNKECFENEKLGFVSIKEMINYYQFHTEAKYNYFTEIKSYGLKSPKFIDFYLGLLGIL